MQKKLDDSGKNAKQEDAAEAPANPYSIGDPGAFARNMVRVGQQSQKLLGDFLKRQVDGARDPVDPLNLA